MLLMQESQKNLARELHEDFRMSKLRNESQLTLNDFGALPEMDQAFAFADLKAKPNFDDFFCKSSDGSDQENTAKNG